MSAGNESRAGRGHPWANTEPAGAQRRVVGEGISRRQAQPTTPGQGAVTSVGPGASGPIGGAEGLVARRIAFDQGVEFRGGQPRLAAQQRDHGGTKAGGGREAAAGVARGHNPVQPAGLDVPPLVRGEIGPQEEGRGGRHGITLVLPSHPDQSVPATLDLAVANQRSRRLVGGERRQWTGLSDQPELSRGLGVAIEPGEHIAVRQAVLARPQRCSSGPGKARRRARGQAYVHGGPGHDQLLRGAERRKHAVEGCDGFTNCGPAGPPRDQRQKLAAKLGPGDAVGSSGETEAQTRDTVPRSSVAPSGTQQVADLFVGAGFRPRDTTLDQRIGDSAVERDPRDAVIGDGGSAKQQPVGDRRQPGRGPKIDRRSTIAGTQPVERGRQQQKAFARLRPAAQSQGRVVQGDRILPPFERGPGQQNPSVAAVERVNPRFRFKELQHLTPAAPLAGGSRGQKDHGRGPHGRVSEPWGDEPGRLPGPAPRQRLIGVHQRRIERTIQVGRVPRRRSSPGHRNQWESRWGDGDAGQPEPHMDQMGHDSPFSGGMQLRTCMQMPRRRRLSRLATVRERGHVFLRQTSQTEDSRKVHRLF